MRKSGRLIIMLAILQGVFLPLLLSPGEVRADAFSPAELRPDSITVSSKYPSASGPADTVFMFEFDLNYQLTDSSADDAAMDTGRLQTRVFEFQITGPEGWEIFVAESSWQLDRRIKSMQLRALGVPQTMVVVASAPWWNNIEPGEYPIVLDVVGDGISDSVTLKAVVTAWYGLEATTTDERLNASTTAGNPAIMDLKMINTGSAVLNHVSITSAKPAGIANQEWAVRFEPGTVKNLEPGEEQVVKVSVTPPANAISGDYYVTLSLASEPALSDVNPSMQVRVSVVTRPTWVALGVAIVVLAFTGLIVAFRVLRQR